MEDLNRSTDKVPSRLDRETFDRCFAQYGGGVRAVLKSKLGNDADVEDCFSRVFEKLWLEGAKVNHVALGAWLFVVARREAALRWRKQKSIDSLIERCAEDVSEFDGAPTPFEGLMREERIESLRAAIRELPNEQQEILHRRFVDDQSFREIAESLNLPLGTALSRLHAAVKRLRTKLND